MEIAHRSCLGIVKLKSLLRCKVYWYNMDRDIENLIQSCPSCQKIGRHNKPTPVQMTELPTSPWSHIAADFYGNLPTGEKILVITDSFSKFPIVEVMKSTTFNIVSTRLDNLFSIFGYPEMIKTDNGPPWDSHEIDLFFKSRGIVHDSSIPYWPRSNGQAERFMPNLSKLIRHSFDAGTDWKDTLRSMLLNYRNCVHPATNEKPSTLFFGREINTGIPTMNNKTSPQYDTVKRHHDTYTHKAKQTADKHCRPAIPIKVNSQVFIRRGVRNNKFQTTYLPDIYTVVTVNGTQITVKNNRTNIIIKRHISFAKLVYNKTNATDQKSDTVNDDNITRKQYPLRSKKQ